MGHVWRQVVAVVVLPVTVIGVVPYWIAKTYSVGLSWPKGGLGWAALLVGIAALFGGGTLFAASLKRFGREGRGTLAPWDPPKNLVVRGPYAYVRNPMISGVILILVAESLLLRSLPHLGWTAAFGLLNALYIPLAEEPGLRARFGQDFDEYSRNVPRLLPRLAPWRRP